MVRMEYLLDAFTPIGSNTDGDDTAPALTWINSGSLQGISI
jgi:hypothetical protein